MSTDHLDWDGEGREEIEFANERSPVQVCQFLNTAERPAERAIQDPLDDLLEHILSVGIYTALTMYETSD